MKARLLYVLYTVLVVGALVASGFAGFRFG